MSVVGLPAQVNTKQKKSSFALPSTKGVDPAVTNVVAKPAVTEESSRPDKVTYDVEQAEYKKTMDALLVKQTAAKAKIAAAGKGSTNERRLELKAELDLLRGDQAKIKGGRGKTLEQVKLIQDSLAKKIQDLQASKSKSSYKSLAEIDAAIKNLDRQVESGMMKLVEEKKALNEISTLKKSRKAFDTFTAQQAAIDADKAKIDAIRAGMDNPEAKAISDKFNALRSELDTINKAHDQSSKGRDALYEEKNAISKEIDIVYNKKREHAAAFRTANDKFYTKLNEDRAKRMERSRLERTGIEDAKRAEVNERLLEEAQAPAFEREIEDCRTLVDFFQRRLGGSGSGSVTPSTGLDRPANIIAGVAKLELRVIEALPAGMVAMKKKSDHEDGNFTGSTKSKKGPRKVVENAAPKNESLNLPFGTLSALLTLGIDSPIVSSEIPKTIESLEAKKKYFMDNQARVTKEKIATAEKRIAVAEAKSLAAVSANGAAPVAPVVAEEKGEEKIEAEVVVA